MGILLAELTPVDAVTAIASLRPLEDPEACLLLHCGRAELSAERAGQVRALVEAGLDWDRVLALAARHGLRALLHRHLARLAPAGLPAAPLASLRDYVEKNSAFGLLFTGELLRLLAALDGNGVEAMPFKGPALAQYLYGHLALRQFCDLDILIRERDVWRASAVLQGQGFVADVDVPETRRATFLRQDYVRLFRRDGGRTIVELHWGVAPRAFAVRFDGDAVWQRLGSMTLQGRAVRVPADEDLLLMLCVHGSRHGWDKLENLASVAELVRRTPSLDWPTVWARAEAMHCRRMVAFGLLLAHGLLESPLPAHAASTWQSSPLRDTARQIVGEARTLDGLPPAFARQMARQLRLKDTYTDRAWAFAREFTTPTPDDWALVDLPGPLSIGYPLVRALRIARKHRAVSQAAVGDLS
ncbi:MAG: nucleotidyltransferase family protein [Vicinamibacteraceae bacterium]